MAELITICAWCLPRICHVLEPVPALEPGEAIEIEWDRFQRVRIFVVNGSAEGTTRRELTISHGICPECSQGFLAGVPARVQ